MQMQQHYLTSMLAGLDSHASLSPTAVEVAMEVCTATLVSRDIHFPHRAFLEVYTLSTFVEIEKIIVQLTVSLSMNREWYSCIVPINNGQCMIIYSNYVMRTHPSSCLSTHWPWQQMLEKLPNEHIGVMAYSALTLGCCASLCECLDVFLVCPCFN